MASNVSTMSTSNNQVYHSHVSPQQAYADLSLENISNLPSGDVKQANSKKRRANVRAPVKSVSFPDLMDQIVENEVREKLSKHFLLLGDIQESERLKFEFDQTTFSLNQEAKEEEGEVT